MNRETETQLKKMHVTHNNTHSPRKTIKQFNHPKIAKLQKGTLVKCFLDKEKHYKDTYQTITKILQNRKKLTD